MRVDPARSGAEQPGTILIIDDEEIIREALEALLTGEGYDVVKAATAAEGMEQLGNHPVDAVLLDLMLPDKNGLEVLDDIRRVDEDLPVIMITAFGTIESAVAATKQGAFYYFTKPFKNDEVLAVLRNAAERRRLVLENRELRSRLRSDTHRFDEIIGGSARIRAVYDLIARAAPSRATVLIQGESGTGKELVAHALHRRSARADKPFVTVNSGNLPPDLLESNLFGHVKGAFTGAVYPKKGLFEVADKGTIFFDEIGNIPLDTQAKLLRVIQQREFMRLGGVDTIKVDVRIIAATNVDLRSMVEAGDFREDLFYRLNVIFIQLPPLRDRKDDIPLLVQHFLEKFVEESRKPPLVVTPEAMDRLMAYDWPGNVRELENVIERAVVLCGDREIGPDLIPDHVSASPARGVPEVVIPAEGIHFREVIIGHERRYIEAALEAAGGVQKKAAELLHIKATTLNEMMKRYDIRPRRKRGAGDGDEPAGEGAEDP
ncbi:MAG: sigma-54-dependent Fis family transcriptional regulator [Acidobacteria bacterium]|nr:sigma-54-dependent Fis family transcriptional regulator [Acidobacteriota bacterium]